MRPLGPFAEPYVEACRFARLRRWPERPGEAALRLERADWYAWADTLPKASAEVHVALIGEPRTVLIADDKTWWVPRLDQLIERMETALNRRSYGPQTAVREAVARLLAERLRDREGSWEEVVLELLLEQEAAGR